MAKKLESYWGMPMQRGSMGKVLNITLNMVHSLIHKEKNEEEANQVVVVRDEHVQL